MPTGQQYGTNVPQTTLTAGILAGSTSFGVTSLVGWPSVPFTATLEIGTSLQEPIDVTAVSGNNITACTRSIDGTVAFAHANGATLTHTDIGRDFRETRSHIDSAGPVDASSEAVHGLTNIGGNVVMGTKETQTVTNKTISGPSASWGSVAVTGLTGATGAPTPRIVGSANGGPPTSGTFLAGDVVSDNSSTFGMWWRCTVGGTPGTWAPVNSYQQAGSLTPSGANNASFILPALLTPYYNNLKIIISGSTAAAGSDFLAVQFNADTSAHYSWQYSGWLSTNAAKTGALNSANNILAGAIGGNGFNGSTVIEVPFFRSTTALKGLSFVSTAASGIVASADNFSTQGGGVWNGASAITSVTLLTLSGSNFNTGTTIQFALTS